MIAGAETDQRSSGPGSVGRSVAVMVAWYAAALLALTAWLGPELAKPTIEPVRSCTARTLACAQWTTSETITRVVFPILLSCLVMSLVTLALMVRRRGSAMVTGTVAAVSGWLAGPCAVLLLLEAWLLGVAVMNSMSR